MPNDPDPPPPASFFQAQVGLMQQAAIGAQATAALVITLGLGMAKFSGVAAGQDWTALLFGVLGWLLLVVLLTASFGKAARRIERAYLADQARLFPGAEPYRLESVLLRRS